jgi:hypothetical protein
MGHVEQWHHVVAFSGRPVQKLSLFPFREASLLLGLGKRYVKFAGIIVRTP